MDPITRKELQEILFKKVSVPAILDQAKADRNAGKVLCLKMDNAVNIYSQILIDYPAPGVAQ